MGIAQWQAPVGGDRRGAAAAGRSHRGALPSSPFGPCFRDDARFESVDPARRRACYDVFSWQPDLWGGGVLAARWGSLGQPPRGPTVLSVPPGAPGAEALDRLLRRRVQRGYRLVAWA